MDMGTAFAICGLVLTIIFGCVLVALHRIVLSKMYAIYTVNKKSEFLICFFCGLLLAMATMMIWYVVDLIILILAVVFIRKKPNSKALIIVIAGIMIVFVSFAGISAKSSLKEDEASTATQDVSEYDESEDLYEDEADEFAYVEQQENTLTDETVAEDESYVEELDEEEPIITENETADEETAIEQIEKIINKEIDFRPYVMEFIYYDMFTNYSVSLHYTDDSNGTFELHLEETDEATAITTYLDYDGKFTQDVSGQGNIDGVLHVDYPELEMEYGIYYVEDHYEMELWNPDGEYFTLYEKEWSSEHAG